MIPQLSIDLHLTEACVKFKHSKIKFLCHKTMAGELECYGRLCSKGFPQFWNFFRYISALHEKKKKN